MADCSSCANLVLVISNTASLQEAAQAAHWIQSHGHLLHGLSIYYDDEGDGAGEQLSAVAESLIAQSLQLAAAKLKPQQLTEVTKSGLYNSGFLKVLPAANLTSLVFQDLSPTELSTLALTQSLGDSLNLWEIAFGGAWGDRRGIFPGSCFTGLKQLTKLTSLHFDGAP